LPAANMFFGLLGYALLVALCGLGLGALGLLAPALSSARQQRSMQHLNASALKLGLMHTVGLLVLLGLAERRPLLGVIGILWLGVSALCLVFGLAAWVDLLGQRICPSLTTLRRSFISGQVLAWGCAFPYAGWLLGVGLLVMAYAAGLAGWITPVKLAAKGSLSE